MNIIQNERPERVFSSTGTFGLTSNNAKFFAYSVQSESACQGGESCGSGLGETADAICDFRLFAFKSLPVCGNEGLCFSAHLAQQDEVFEQAWSIYTEAFTPTERRSRQEHAQVMRDPRYRFSAIMQERAVVGVLAWWELPGFCFVEHFAISSAQRSGGFGRRAMALLQSHAGRPIVVDVEPFGSDLQAGRRVAFYERLGFVYSAQSVMLPAYAGKPLAPSNFMAWGLPLDGAGRGRVFEAIVNAVYRQPCEEGVRSQAAGVK